MSSPTELLHRWKANNEEALNELIEVLYADLRSAAIIQLRKQWSNAQIQPTELVAEAYLRIQNLYQIEWQDRSHFIAVITKVMRQVLLDSYRREHADKRQHEKVTLVTAHQDSLNDSETFAAAQLLEAMEELSAVSPDYAELVELKFFGGLGHAEIAELRGVSESTVKRQWRAARAWLQSNLVSRSEGEDATE